MKSYNSDDLAKIMATLNGVEYKWKSIGLQLGITYGQLRAIGRRNLEDCESCLQDVVHSWLTSGGKQTSEQLSQALKTVGEKGLAEKIYLPAGKSGVCSGSASVEMHKPDSDRSNMISNVSASIEEDDKNKIYRLGSNETIVCGAAPIQEEGAHKNQLKSSGIRLRYSTPIEIQVNQETHQQNKKNVCHQFAPSPKHHLRQVVKKRAHRKYCQWHYLIALIIFMICVVVLFDIRLYSSTGIVKVSPQSSLLKENEVSSIKGKPNIQTKTGHSSSLPIIKEGEIFVGRTREMKAIMEMLNDSTIDIINIFASPGFGKHTIVKHIGHAMKKQGFNVHFISLEHIQSTGFEEEVNSITDGKTVKHWAIDVNINTLIILDKVNNYWYDHIYELKATFINPIVQYSQCIKIIMTSTNRIYAIDRSTAYPLFNLNMDDCAMLFQTIMESISSKDAERICVLVGGIPLVIKVVASVMKPPSVFTVAYVIDSLKTSNTEFIASQSELVIGKDKIINALELGFKSLTEECFLCSLLLLRSGHYFNLEKAQHVLSKEMRKYMAGTVFHVEKCLHQLAHASLIEIKKSFSKGNVYLFHTVVKNYLADQKVNDTWLLEAFWKNYYHLPFWYRNLDLIIMDPPRLLQEDIALFNFILQRTDDYFILNHLLDNYTVGCDGCPYIQLISRMVNEKLNCSIPSHIRGHVMLHVWFIGRPLSRTICSIKVNHNYTAEPLEAVKVEESFIRRCDYHCTVMDLKQYNCQIKQCRSQESSELN